MLDLPLLRLATGMLGSYGLMVERCELTDPARVVTGSLAG